MGKNYRLKFPSVIYIKFHVFYLFPVYIKKKIKHCEKIVKPFSCESACSKLSVSLPGSEEHTEESVSHGRRSLPLSRDPLTHAAPLSPPPCLPVILFVCVYSFSFVLALVCVRACL